MGFWDSSFLWFEAVVASMAVAAMSAVVGVYTILRRVVFLPAALSQVSGFGVVLGFYLVVHVPLFQHADALVEIVALVVTLGLALAMGWMREPRRLSREVLIGVAYVLAGGLVIIIGDSIPQESHDIKNILFGNAVMVEQRQMWWAVGTAVVVLMVHVVLFHHFLFVSFDPQTARAQTVPVRSVDAMLFLTLGLTVTVATKTIGALPVFAFSVLPPIAAIGVSNNLRWVLVLSAILGALAAFLGYWGSFVWSIPTGACMVIAAGVCILPALAATRWRKKHRGSPG